MKKGIAPVVAWILILTLSVGIGAIVVTWYVKHAESITKEYVTETGSEIECGGINLNVGFNEEECKLIIVNTGKKKIHKLKVFISEKEVEFDEEIPPREKKEFSLHLGGVSIKNVLVNPVIKIDDKLYICENERVYNPRGEMEC